MHTMFKFITSALRKLAMEYDSLEANNRTPVPAWCQKRFGPMFYYPTELAYQGDDIVGALTWDVDMDKGLRTLNVYQLEVREDMRGLGVAQNLLENAIDDQKPHAVNYAYDTEAGKKLAEKLAQKYTDVVFEIWDSRDEAD